MTTRLWTLALALMLAACASAGREDVARYTNPVLDADFPDPAVLRAPDGFFYAYATQGGAPMRNLQVARSADLVRWELLGDALPVKPRWATGTQDLWAPDISYRDGRYWLYYSARPDPTPAAPEPGLCLAVATADRPEGPFTDSGRPLQCGEGFVNIDPFAHDDPATGKRLLYWGSGFGPIKVQELAPDGLGFASGSVPVPLVDVIRDEAPGNYQRLVEAAAVISRDGWHYLFHSGDNCCGPKAHYAVMVARSRSATGPFRTRAQETGSADSVILRLNARWIAPGHNGVVQDAAGDWWFLYHAVDPRRPSAAPGGEPNTRRVMLLDRVVWRDGWPEIADGTPSTEAQRAPR